MERGGGQAKKKQFLSAKSRTQKNIISPAFDLQKINSLSDVQ